MGMNPVVTTTAQTIPAVASQVNLLQLAGTLSRYDGNRDGQMSRQEVAQAALDSPTDTAQFSLLYTMLLSGKDGQGLFPDRDNNSLLSMAELSELAAYTGDKNAIDPTDFNAGFGTRAEDNREVSPADAKRMLQAIVEGRNPYDPVTPPGGGAGGNNGIMGIFSQFLKLITSFLQMFMGGGNGNIRF